MSRIVTNVRKFSQKRTLGEKPGKIPDTESLITPGYFVL